MTNVTENSQIPLVLTFHPFNFKVRGIIWKYFHILKNDPETSSIFSNNPLVSFLHRKNIREILVHNKLHQESSPLSRTFPCGVAQCKACKFIDSSTVISALKLTYNIKHNFTCTSTLLIYCISCSRCGMLYIGDIRYYGYHLHIDLRFESILCDIAEPSTYPSALSRN